MQNPPEPLPVDPDPTVIPDQNPGDQGETPADPTTPDGQDTTDPAGEIPPLN